MSLSYIPRHLAYPSAQVQDMPFLHFAEAAPFSLPSIAIDIGISPECPNASPNALSQRESALPASLAMMGE